MGRVLLLLAIASMAVAVNAIVCLPGACDNIQCNPNITAENCVGQFEPYGSFCSCCPTCLSIIPAGNTCILLSGVPPTSICEEGTTCIGGTCQANVQISQ